MQPLPGGPGGGYGGMGGGGFGGAAPVRRGLPWWAWTLIIGAIVVALVVVAVCGGLIWLGARAPETHAVSGSQMRRDHMSTINSLGLLDPGEQIRWFYSDATVDITDGMYFLTDRKVVIYASELQPPSIIVPLERIVQVRSNPGQSWMNDSTIWLELDDGSEVQFPVAIEQGGDKKFVDALKAGAERAAKGKTPGSGRP